MEYNRIKKIEADLATIVAGGPSSAITSLTNNTGGTPGDTLADVPGTYNEATLANQIASLAAKVNAMLVVMRAHGLIAE